MIFIIFLVNGNSVKVMNALINLSFSSLESYHKWKSVKNVSIATEYYCYIYLISSIKNMTVTIFACAIYIEHETQIIFKIVTTQLMYSSNLNCVLKSSAFNSSIKSVGKLCPRSNLYKTKFKTFVSRSFSFDILYWWKFVNFRA